MDYITKYGAFQRQRAMFAAHARYPPAGIQASLRAFPQMFGASRNLKPR
jgi:hypothetical protein